MSGGCARPCSELKSKSFPLPKGGGIGTTFLMAKRVVDVLVRARPGLFVPGADAVARRHRVGAARCARRDDGGVGGQSETQSTDAYVTDHI